MGSIFNKYKILHAFPKDGQKIKAITNKTKSWFINVVEDTKKLEIGREYTVRKTELNSSTSYVWLEEFPSDSVFFNIHVFKWDLPEIDLKDLNDFYLHDMNHIHHKYGWGIQHKDNIRYEGTPMLIIECDKDERVVNASFKN